MHTLRMTMGGRLSLVLIGVILFGCVSNPETASKPEPAITSNEDPSADFTTYRTYN